MIADEEMRESKAEFNARYGKWMCEIRAEIAQSVENVAAATGVDADAIREIESGKSIELYDAIRMCKYYGVESE